MQLKHPTFVFDLDSTITKCEILPLLAREAGLEAEMRLRTECAMRGEVDFARDFSDRAMLLRGIPLSRARGIVRSVPLHDALAAFVRAHRERTWIVTGNLDVWISSLLEKLGMAGRCLSSTAITNGERLLGVGHVLHKGEAVAHLPRPLVAVGDGSNDIPMLRAADYAIAFGGARRLSDDVCKAANCTVEDEGELCRLLEDLL